MFISHIYISIPSEIKNFIDQFSGAQTITKRHKLVTPVAKNRADKLDHCLAPECSKFHLNWRREVSFPNFYQKVNLIFNFRQTPRLIQYQGIHYSKTLKICQSPLYQLKKKHFNVQIGRKLTYLWSQTR